MKCAWIMAIFLLGAGLAFASPDFSGQWKLNVDKSDFGPLPAPQKRTEQVEHKEPSLHVVSNQVANEGETTTDLRFTIDGKECRNDIQGNELKSTLKWEADILVFESLLNFQGLEIKIEERWRLSEDGKVLTVTRHLSSSMGELDQSEVLEKQ